ncbi:MAG: cytochrome c oxidase accessory protein CcoG [Bacteroidota bacterium]
MKPNEQVPGVSSPDEWWGEEDAFRNSIGTIQADGKRNWITPRQPKGRYYNRRTWFSAVLLLLLFSGPFIHINGEPLFLFNILKRKFILFGVIFWPQDFHLFVLAMITGIVAIVLFTVAFGRLWCGWACPQTVFMEMVFRRIEYWIEGDGPAQRRLNKAPWNAEKIRKKVIKLSIFALFSFLIGNLVMAYVVGWEELSVIITHSPAANWGVFTFVMIFSGIFYFVFAWFREQACIAVCPYGRLQGAMLNKDSIVVAYDFVRGEPRGRRKKNDPKAEEKGDCIDCHMCVAVCPTGIDIRNGTQMECVNCTACIDACDSIMDKVKKPRGLVRYASHAGIEEGKSFHFSRKMMAYTAVLCVLMGILTWGMTTRTQVETTLLRTSGILYQETDNGGVSNLYNIQLINKSKEPVTFSLKLTKPETGSIQTIGQSLLVPPQGIYKGSCIVEIPKTDLKGTKTPIRVEVWTEDRRLDVFNTNFLGPLVLPQ